MTHLTKNRYKIRTFQGCTGPLNAKIQTSSYSFTKYCLLEKKLDTQTESLSNFQVNSSKGNEFATKCNH